MIKLSLSDRLAANNWFCWIVPVSPEEYISENEQAKTNISKEIETRIEEGIIFSSYIWRIMMGITSNILSASTAVTPDVTPDVASSDHTSLSPEPSMHFVHNLF